MKQLKGTEPVESLDLSQERYHSDHFDDRYGHKSRIGIVSAIVIASLIGANPSLTDLNLASCDMVGRHTGKLGDYSPGEQHWKSCFNKLEEVQGSSFNVGDKVMYRGREVIVSYGKDDHGDIKMIDLSGVKAIADALRISASITSVRPSPELQSTGPALTHFFLARTD